MPKDAKKLLIIDKSATMRKLLTSICKSRFKEIAVLVAENGNAAWDIIQETPLCGVICNRSLPDRSGLEILVRLRESEAHKELPVMIIFDEPERNAVVKVIHLGASELLVKPFTKRDIAVKLKRMLGITDRRSCPRYDVPPKIKTSVSVSEGASLFSSGEVVNICIDGLKAKLRTSDKLAINRRLDLRVKFVLNNKDTLAKTFEVVLVRIESIPNKKQKNFAFYCCTWADLRPDQKQFLDDVIHLISKGKPELIG